VIEKASPPDQSSASALEDTAMRRLSKEERARLGIDSWEPSLLRALLAAQNQLDENKEN
jgi:hypothetical protein